MGKLKRAAKPPKPRDVTLGEYYQHVDNGGLTMRVTAWEESGEYTVQTLEIEDGYHDYSEHILRFNKVDPDELIEFGRMLVSAAEKLRRGPK